LGCGEVRTPRHPISLAEERGARRERILAPAIRRGMAIIGTLWAGDRDAPTSIIADFAQ